MFKFFNRKDPVHQLLHEDWEIRNKARKALDKIDPEWKLSGKIRGRVPEFIAALDDTDGYVREAAAELLFWDQSATNAPSIRSFHC